MTLFFIGRIISSDVTERADKTTGQVHQYLIVNTACELVTKEGKPKLYAEDIQVPIEFKDIIEQSVGKYIFIPYQYISSKNGSYLFVDDKYKPIIVDQNPLLESKPTKRAA